jgi:hypothetical protein
MRTRSTLTVCILFVPIYFALRLLSFYRGRRSRRSRSLAQGEYPLEMNTRSLNCLPFRYIYYIQTQPTAIFFAYFLNVGWVVFSDIGEQPFIFLGLLNFATWETCEIRPRENSCRRLPRMEHYFLSAKTAVSSILRACISSSFKHLFIYLFIYLFRLSIAFLSVSSRNAQRSLSCTWIDVSGRIMIRIVSFHDITWTIDINLNVMATSRFASFRGRRFFLISFERGESDDSALKSMDLVRGMSFERFFQGGGIHGFWRLSGRDAFSTSPCLLVNDSMKTHINFIYSV